MQFRRQPVVDYIYGLNFVAEFGSNVTTEPASLLFGQRNWTPVAERLLRRCRWRRRLNGRYINYLVSVPHLT